MHMKNMFLLNQTKKHSTDDSHPPAKAQRESMMVGGLSPLTVSSMVGHFCHDTELNCCAAPAQGCVSGHHEFKKGLDFASIVIRCKTHRHHECLVGAPMEDFPKQCCLELP